MIDRTKYDIMENEEKTASLAVIDLLVDIHELVQKLEKGELSSDVCRLQISELISQSYFNFKLMAHIGYENAKDIIRLSPDLIKTSLHIDGISLSNFVENYERVINRYAKTLLIFSVLDEEEIDISEVADISIFNSIIQGSTEELLSYLIVRDKNLDPENCEIMMLFKNENFISSDLAPEHIKKLNDYHDSFVRRYINPKITADRNDSMRVIMQAKRISTAGRFN